MRDGFSAPGAGVSQERWDGIFKKPVCHGVSQEDWSKPAEELKKIIDAMGLEMVSKVSAESICKCGHPETYHNDTYSDGVRNGHFTECRVPTCHCSKFRKADNQ